MPKLIQNIQAVVLDNIEGSIIYLNPIIGQIGVEDYIKLSKYEFYLQNLTKADVVEELIKPSNFGLKNNTEMVTIEISY